MDIHTHIFAHTHIQTDPQVCTHTLTCSPHTVTHTHRSQWHRPAKGHGARWLSLDETKCMRAFASWLSEDWKRSVLSRRDSMEPVEASFVVLLLSISLDKRLMVDGERRVISCWVNLRVHSVSEHTYLVLVGYILNAKINDQIYSITQTLLTFSNYACKWIFRVT